MHKLLSSPRGSEVWPGMAAIESLYTINRNVVAAVIDFNGTLCSRLAAVNNEWGSFIGKRLAEDFELSRRFAACRSPDQVMNAYGPFLQTAFEQYQAELAHMLKLGQTFAMQNGFMLKEQIETQLREGVPKAAPTSALQEDHRPRAARGDRRHLNSAA